MSGALAILNHLVNNMVQRNVDFVLLKDSRAPKLQSEDGVKRLVVMNDSEWARLRYYKEHRNDFHSVLCMGNVPPMIKMPCKVHTYFHNVILMSRPKGYPLGHTVRALLKKMVIQSVTNYTDTWLVQTSNTKDLTRKYLAKKSQPIYEFPIYSIPHELEDLANRPKGKDYVFIGQYTNAKGHDQLFKAWEILHEQGINPRLHLTVSVDYVLPLIKALQEKGIDIVNHGFVPHEEVVDIYRQGKALIYPSFNESFGLGLIEALHAGLDIICSDLPFAHCVCKPSEVFNPYSPQSIVEAVKRYETGESPQSEPLLYDMVDELIDFLVK